MSDERPAAKPATGFLETELPLSRSVIWRLQREYYVLRGLEAWTQDMVPSYITNNPLIAELYAGIVAAYMEDCLRQGPPLSRENPLRIMELGSGTGKFCWLFLRKLSGLLRERNLPLEHVCYTMTDCSGPLLAATLTNSYMAEFTRSGMLEFKLFSVGEKGLSSTPKLAAALPGSTGARSSRMEDWGKAPLVVIANYVFDSLPQDAFVISQGEIFEALVTARSSSAAVESAGGLDLSFTNAPLRLPRYPHASWNAVLEHYRATLPAATIFFPSAALEQLEQLSHSSDGRMLVLAADKGFAHPDELALLQGPPPLEFHAADACFSAMVNFDAIGRCFTAAGGEAFLPQKHFTSLNLCGFLEYREKERRKEDKDRDDFPATRRAFREAHAAFGPDDMFAVMSWLNAHFESASVPQVLALLRLTRWDPTALLRLYPVIAPKLRGIVGERNDLRAAVLRTWENHYPVVDSDNMLAFTSGVILLELRFYAEAMPMFQTAEQLLGPSAALSYNLGLCAVGLERPAEALAYMKKACELDPSFEPARNVLAKLEKSKL